MKNPNRNVIVEYKNRRASKNRNSLWGNLDLKSIARSVEEDASVRSAPVIPAAPAPVPDTSGVTVNAIAPVPGFAAPMESDIDIKREPDPISGIPGGFQEIPMKPKKMQKPRLSTMASSSIAKSTGNRRDTRLPLSKMDLVAKLSVIQTGRDELAALQIENTALKQRLGAKLRVENNQLKRMLERLQELQTIVC